MYGINMLRLKRGVFFMLVAASWAKVGPKDVGTWSGIGKESCKAELSTGRLCLQGG